MISYVKGILGEILEQEIVVEAGGIGYGIQVPVTVLDRLPGLGKEVKIYTYMQVREDGLSLFGFLNRQDLLMFRQLIGVSGIGPKGDVYKRQADDWRRAWRREGCRQMWSFVFPRSDSGGRTILEMLKRSGFPALLRQNLQRRI